MWTDEKESQEENRTCRKSEGRRSEMEKVRKEKMQVREKVGKSCDTVFFPVLRGSGGSKSRLAKAAGAEVEHVGLGPLLDVAISKKCKPLWREAYLQ